VRHDQNSNCILRQHAISAENAGLIGLQLPTLIRGLSRAGAWPAAALAVTGTLIVIRIVWMFPLSAIIQRRGGTRRRSWPVPAVGGCHDDPRRARNGPYPARD
jgi:hypothetical protein